MTVYGPAPGSGPGLLFEPTATDEERDPTRTDLRLGDWRDVLAGETWDTAILDMGYSARTHKGHAGANEAAANNGMFPNVIEYEPMDRASVFEAVGFLVPRTRGWFVTMTSHDLIPHWEEALKGAGLYVFAPLPYVDPGKAPRVVGDGPASWTVSVLVARPRKMEWLRDWQRQRKASGLSRSLPGEYRRSPGDTIYKPSNGKQIQGGKPIGVMRAIVRDYSHHGQRVGDPTAGHGTTLAAADAEGRTSIGAEQDPATHAAAARRLDMGCTIDMFARARVPVDVQYRDAGDSNGVPPGTEEPIKCQSCDGQPEAGPLPWDPSCRTGACPDCGASDPGTP